MAVKIKMLRDKFIPVHGVLGKEGETYKVNNEVGNKLVLENDAEYVDPELQARLKGRRLEKEVAEVESAAMESSEKAVNERPRAKRWRK